MFTKQILPGSNWQGWIKAELLLVTSWSPMKEPEFHFSLRKRGSSSAGYKEKLETQMVYRRFYAFREGAVPRCVTYLVLPNSDICWPFWGGPTSWAIALPLFSPASYANTFIPFPVVETTILGSFMHKTNKWSGFVSVFIFTSLYIYEYFNAL